MAHSTAADAVVQTRFMVISDTHDLDFEEAMVMFKDLPKVNVLLHCGDLTQCGGLNSYKKALRIFSLVSADLKLVIAGNHDLELDGEYWTKNLQDGDEAEEHDDAMTFWDEDAAEAGVTYLDEGTHHFDLSNGASFSIYASPWQPAFGDFAFGYKHTDDRFNQQRHCIAGAASIVHEETVVPDYPAVDVMMTHGPPKGMHDRCHDGNVGCPNLLQALRRARPLLHCFGHIHEGFGASQVTWHPDAEPQISTINVNESKITYTGSHGKETTVVNAAIMNGENRPENVPVIIDIPLPRALHSSLDALNV